MAQIEKENRRFSFIFECSDGFSSAIALELAIGSVGLLWELIAVCVGCLMLLLWMIVCHAEAKSVYRLTLDENGDKRPPYKDVGLPDGLGDCPATSTENERFIAHRCCAILYYLSNMYLLVALFFMYSCCIMIFGTGSIPSAIYSVILTIASSALGYRSRQREVISNVVYIPALKRHLHEY